MIPPHGRVVALDLGERRIGVAVSDASRTIATPIDTVDARDPAAARRRVAELCREWEAVGLVVGLPLSMSGADGPAAVAARAEAEQMGAASGVPVELMDERLTTVEADRRLREAAPARDARRRRDVIDRAAAAVMLEAWLANGPRDPAS